MFINFSDIPNSPNIFLDYLYEFENVQKYFKTNFRNESDQISVLKNVSKSKEQREQIHQILKRQNEDFDISEKSKENIEAILDDNTYAVITGQQLGLFTGPLYTIYKIITTIKLSELLNRKYFDKKFIPIFWLEGDDHDFNEVKSIKILDNENSISTIDYDDGLDEETNRGPMGNYTLDLTIEKTFEKLRLSLRETEFKNALLELLRKYYYPGATFKSSFSDLIRYFFDKYGLIVFDPQDNQVKELLKPIFKKDIEQFRFISELLVQRSAELEQTYYAQVKIKPINLFLIEDGGRYLIEPTDQDFRLKGKRRKFELTQLNELIDTSPEKFSPNVILRPICQDYLFPTFAYVAGPSEISYHAQILPYYEILNITPPILYPRGSATIIESKVQNILEKYNLTLQNFFGDTEQLAIQSAEKNSDVKINDIFRQINGEISSVIDELSDNLSVIDNTLVDVCDGTKIKFEQYLNQIKEKALLAQKRKNEVIFRQIYKTANLLYPDENLQERELNFIYFANKYSLDVINKIYELLEIERFEHQIIQI